MKPCDRGAYCLLIYLRGDRQVTVGRLGHFRFPKGYYVYCGSAMNGLAARVARHHRATKRIHWHIDYLLALPAARLIAAVPYPSPSRHECELNRRVQAQPGATILVPGFGSSDCAEGCRAHLAFFPKRLHLPPPNRKLEIGNRKST